MQLSQPNILLPLTKSGEKPSRKLYWHNVEMFPATTQQEREED
jgi:hypothetical protein